MIIVVHADTKDHNVVERMGKADYSYYFVLEAFKPILDKIGAVAQVRDPGQEIDAIYELGPHIDQQVVCLSFTPPHATLVDLQCPVIPVFAWEFEDIPNEDWSKDPRSNWRYALGRAGQCITHSSHSQAVVKKAMGEAYPVTAIPAPIEKPKHLHIAPIANLELQAKGQLFDSGDNSSTKSTNDDTKQLDAQVGFEIDLGTIGVEAEPAQQVKNELFHVTANGVIYTSVINVNDGRKNWRDMVDGFCYALRERDDAVLVLKITGNFSEDFRLQMHALIARHRPIRCRVIVIDAHLDDNAYKTVIAGSSYAVNTSHGEGQCLPLMQSMAWGKPGVAPVHTGMADYLNEDNGFLVETSMEPASWPQDLRNKIRTMRHRLHIQSLIEAYRESYRVAKYEPEKYQTMAQAAVDSLNQYTSEDRIEVLLRQAIEQALSQN